MEESQLLGFDKRIPPQPRLVELWMAFLDEQPGLFEHAGER